MNKFSSYSIVDDLIATGGTAKSVSDLLQREGKSITGLLTVVELKGIRKKNQFNFPVDSMLMI